VIIRLKVAAMCFGFAADASRAGDVVSWEYQRRVNVTDRSRRGRDARA
jgi:hypothetical protein